MTANNNISFGKNYWIFPHIHENAEQNFKELVQKKNWQLGTDKSIQLIKEGDFILFYLSIRGENIKYFAGEAIITHGPHPPTRESVGDPKARRYEVDFDNVSIWTPGVDWADVRDNLNFVRKATNVGMAFKGRTLIPIDKEDYDLIKSFAER